MKLKAPAQFQEKMAIGCTKKRLVLDIKQSRHILLLFMDLKPKNKVHLLCSYGYAPDQTPALLPGENDNATVNTISYQ
ncbi:hypothetical protein T4B_2469 [Trichinella pseudospiralis]|uniref:Uncharacterized protein n=1 Tax=Trichinella pseudospiralis TaxID=6337 RepID=A0A0V1GH45_TRIPS|nr:hypothetical protein T4B_2469 [Trichinella pseudospiralis]